MGNSAGFRTFSAFRGYSAFLTPQSAKRVKYSAFSYQNSAFFVQNGIKSRRIWQVNAEFVLISAETRVSRGLVGEMAYVGGIVAVEAGEEDSEDYYLMRVTKAQYPLLATDDIGGVEEEALVVEGEWMVKCGRGLYRYKLLEGNQTFKITANSLRMVLVGCEWVVNGRTAVYILKSSEHEDIMGTLG